VAKIDFPRGTRIRESVLCCALNALSSSGMLPPAKSSDTPPKFNTAQRQRLEEEIMQLNGMLEPRRQGPLFGATDGDRPDQMASLCAAA